jgi:DNA-directed RNA polymerase subunit alpha
MDYNIILPSKPRIVSEEEGRKGTYEIDGLYAGYGHTLGNSLRRIILSSLPGSAVTSVKIEGVPHEFSAMNGVLEDVITILLNIKRIRFAMHADEPQTAKISVKGSSKGSRVVTAADIECPSQLEVLNKDQHIATLTSKDVEFNIEMNIEKGLGYIGKENYHKEKVEVGTIALDAMFTPIRKVNYDVENMRVGDRTDYNRLRMIIETDGIISPREALEKSIDIMISHLRAVRGFQEEETEEEKAPVTKKEMKELEKEAEDSKEGEGDSEILKTRIEDLQLSPRTLNALSEAGIRTVGGLVRKKEEDILEVEGIGAKAVQELKDALKEFGLSLKQ